MKHRFDILISCATILLSLTASAAKEPVSYHELRKRHVVSAQLACGVETIRREHRQFVNYATDFIRQNSKQTESRGEVAAAFYMRGEMMIRYGLYKRGRSDFQASLDILDNLPLENRPHGLPSVNLLNVYMAITHIEDGFEPFASALESCESLIPGEATDYLKKTLYSACSQLERTGRLERAIRVYSAIIKLNAWDPDKDQDPEKMIEVLQYRLENLKSQGEMQ
jgi:tetratricopeptide (TPR) repeat protein